MINSPLCFQWWIANFVFAVALCTLPLLPSEASACLPPEELFCQKLEGHEDPGATPTRKVKLPDVRDRDLVLHCAGMEQAVKGYDHLEKDMLFMRSAYKSYDKVRKKMDESPYKTEATDKLPKKTLMKFMKMVRVYYSRQ